jgi:hypothetical protein
MTRASAAFARAVRNASRGGHREVGEEEGEDRKKHRAACIQHHTYSLQPSTDWLGLGGRHTIGSNGLSAFMGSVKPMGGFWTTTVL